MPEELAGVADKELDIDKEVEFWSNWMHSGVEHNDVRTLLGAFEEERMLGVAFASFAEEGDSICGFELNGLWVYPEMRGRGIALLLVTKLLKFYEHLGLKEIIIYNYHNSSANSFYRKFGGIVVKTELQMEEQIPTDIFRSNISSMLELMNISLLKYK